MISDQNGNTYVYDAWNRLVAVKNSSGTVIAQYTYNAMGYRVTESYPQGGTGIPAGEIDYIYYDSQWQAIETRTNGTAASNVSSQMVWSAAYINAAILQDSYTAGVIQPNSRLYFLQDANWNTIAIVNFSGAWQVLQQYIYSPYGTITVLNEDGAGSTPVVNNLYQGMTLDSVTGLYYARNRNYSPTLGRWINQDPAGYINGANTYQFVMSNPVGKTDPEGTQSVGMGYGPPFGQTWGGWNPQQAGVMEQAKEKLQDAQQQVDCEVDKCAADAGRLATTVGLISVEIGAAVGSDGDVLPFEYPLLAWDLNEVNQELGALKNDDCAPSYRSLINDTQSLIGRIETLISPPPVNPYTFPIMPPGPE
jgi:RHS repeat-associated protein